MLTDDDLLRELERGFREETAGLRYTGRVPAPRRSSVVPWTAVPLGAAAAAVLVLPQLGGGPTPLTAAPEPPAPPASSASSAAPTVAASPALVTDRIELAGMTLRYAHPEGTPPPSTELFLGVRPPADVEEVDLAGSPEGRWLRHAWVGTDPSTGLSGLFVETRDTGTGRHAFFAATGVTLEEWARMVRTGSNR